MDLGRLCALALIPILVLGTALLSVAQAASPQQSGWEIVHVYPGDTMTVEMLGPTNVWTGGYEQFLHYTGGDRWYIFTAGENSWVTGLDFASASSAWGSTSRGEILRLDATGWHVFNRPTTAWLDDIAMSSGTDGWAVGEQGRIVRYSGGTWKEYVGSPTTSWLTAVDMVSPSNGWAVGSRIMIKWDGGGWRFVSSPDTTFRDVYMVSATDGWAVGSGIYHYNGSDWSPVPRPPGGAIQAMDMLPDGTGWAVGNGGLLLYYDGKDWYAVDGPTEEDLLDVSLYATNDGWAVGRSGVFLHYTGLPAADLSPSSKAVSSILASPGDVLTYTINLRNDGGPAFSVVVTDATPLGTTYKAGSASTTRGTIEGTDPLVVDLGTVGPGGVATITFEVTVDPGASDCWFAINRATIDGGEILTRTAISTIGSSCFKVYLPLAFRD